MQKCGQKVCPNGPYDSDISSTEVEILFHIFQGPAIARKKLKHQKPNQCKSKRFLRNASVAIAS